MYGIIFKIHFKLICIDFQITHRNSEMGSSYLVENIVIRETR